MVGWWCSAWTGGRDHMVLGVAILVVGVAACYVSVLLAQCSSLGSGWRLVAVVLGGMVAAG
jgi:hypothetical protein